MRETVPSTIEQSRDSASDKGRWPVCLGVVLFFLGVYLFVGGEGFYSTDGETMLRTTWAIVDKGRLSVPCDPGQPSAIQGRDGRCYSRYGLGQPVAAVPLYLVGKAVHTLFPSLDYGEVLRFTMARLNQFIMALVCGMMCALGGLLYRSSRMGIGLALLFGMGTLALPYSRFYFNEPLTTLGFLIALYGVITHRCSGKRAWLFVGGAGFGLSVLTRTTSALILPLFLIDVWFADVLQTGDRETEQSCTARAVQVVLFLLPVIALGLIQTGYQVWAFGNPFSGGYQDEGWQTPLLTGVYGLLFSPGKSLLLFVPVAILAPWGWARWFIEGRRREALLFVTAFVVWLLFHAGWWTWHGGWSWGPRFMVPMLPFLILPLGSLWRLGTGARVAVIVLALIGFLIQLGGVLMDFNDYMLWINDEDKILFSPAYLPILGHWRMVWNGEAVNLAILNMPRWTTIAWVTVCGTLIVAGVCLIRSQARAEKAT